MPEFFANSDASARGLRESRRSDAHRPSVFAARRGIRSKPSGAFSENYHCENGHFGAEHHANNSRPSPRLSSFTGAAHRNFGSLRGAPGGGVMTDITNVAAMRASLADKTKPVKQAQEHVTSASEHTAQHALLEQAAAGALIVPRQELSLFAALAPKAPAGEVVAEEKFKSPAPTVNHGDPQIVQEYAPDIIRNFFETEALALPQANYMETQADVTSKMRMILIDWLLEVHLKYRLCPETLHLTVNLIDRYLSRKQITRKRLQLVGVAAMFIASKFEEITPPELNDWVFITDNAYTKDDVLMMECNMLVTLNFKIVVPTAAHFFEHLAVANGCDAVHRSCAQYLLELGLLDLRMLQHTPSHVVAAAMLLSNELFARSSAWPAAMVHEARNSEQSLRQCAEELRQLWKADRAGAGGQLQAVHKKFSIAQNHSVATMSF